VDADKKVKGKQSSNSKQHSKKKLTEKEIEELMRHSSYKRGHGGSIRQVK